MLRCDSEEALLIAIFVTASMHCTSLVSSIIDSNPGLQRFFFNSLQNVLNIHFNFLNFLTSHRQPFLRRKETSIRFALQICNNNPFRKSPSTIALIACFLNKIFWQVHKSNNTMG